MGYLDAVGHVFLLLSSMSETADDNDVLGWELDQLKKLKRLAEEYGWDEEDPKYKARLKQVQALGKQRALDALGKGGGKEPKGPKTTYAWESCMEFKAKDWTEAKYKLVKVHSGEWEPDRRSAQSTSGGLVVRRFKCKDKGEGLLYLARIINLQGGSWRLQRGIVEDLVEEEPSDSDHDKAEDDDEDDGEAGPSGASERRGTEPPAKKAPRVAPAAAAEPEPAVEAKRQRKQRQR